MLLHHNVSNLELFKALWKTPQQLLAWWRDVLPELQARSQLFSSAEDAPYLPTCSLHAWHYRSRLRKRQAFNSRLGYQQRYSSSCSVSLCYSVNTEIKKQKTWRSVPCFSCCDGQKAVGKRKAKRRVEGMKQDFASKRSNMPCSNTRKHSRGMAEELKKKKTECTSMLLTEMSLPKTLACISGDCRGAKGFDFRRCQSVTQPIEVCFTKGTEMKKRKNQKGKTT